MNTKEFLVGVLCGGGEAVTVLRQHNLVYDTRIGQTFRHGKGGTLECPHILEV